MDSPDPPPAPPATRRSRGLALATAGYAGILVWATHHPRPDIFLGPNPPSDKLLHVNAYAILGALVAATLAAAGRLSGRTLPVAAAALAAFAVLDEATQPLPWFRRTADPIDWVFDLVGIAAGLLAVVALVALVRRFRARRAGRPLQ